MNTLPTLHNDKETPTFLSLDESGHKADIQPSNAEAMPGYAGVTVWIGNRSITRTVSIEQFAQLFNDPLSTQFADANATLRAARWADGAQPQ